MVKDLRTNVETGNAQGVLDGDLDKVLGSLARRPSGRRAIPTRRKRKPRPLRLARFRGHRLDLDQEFRLRQAGDDDHRRAAFDVADILVADGPEAGHVVGIDDVNVQSDQIL